MLLGVDWINFPQDKNQWLFSEQGDEPSVSIEE
jgi:hypothetical protein